MKVFSYAEKSSIFGVGLVGILRVLSHIILDVDLKRIAVVEVIFFYQAWRSSIVMLNHYQVFVEVFEEYKLYNLVTVFLSNYVWTQMRTC